MKIKIFVIATIFFIFISKLDKFNLANLTKKFYYWLYQIYIYFSAILFYKIKYR